MTDVVHSPAEEAAPFVQLSAIDLDPRGEEQAVDWLDSHHLAEVVGHGACLRALRYACLNDAGFHLLLFESSDPPTELVRPPLDAPAGRWIRACATAAYRLTSHRGDFRSPATFLNAITVTVAPDAATAFDRWYDTVHIPEIVGCPGWHAARRFRSLDDRSHFLALYDIEDPSLAFSTDEYEQAVGWDGFERSITSYFGFRAYRLEAQAHAA